MAKSQRKRTKKKVFVPTERQLDPERLKTDEIQYWSKLGTMLTLLPLETAKLMVADPDNPVFVVNEQAISEY